MEVVGQVSPSTTTLAYEGSSSSKGVLGARDEAPIDMDLTDARFTFAVATAAAPPVVVERGWTEISIVGPRNEATRVGDLTQRRTVPGADPRSTENEQLESAVNSDRLCVGETTTFMIVRRDGGGGEAFRC